MAQSERIVQAGISVPLEKKGLVPPVIQPGLEPQRSPKKKNNAGRLVTFAAAATLAVGGLLGANAFINKGGSTNPDNSPIPSLGGYIPGESNSPEPIIVFTPSPQSSETTVPTNTPEPTPSASPSQNTEKNPLLEMTLQQRLDAWVDGKINLPGGKKFSLEYSSAPLRLNIVDSKLEKDSNGDYLEYYHGLVLGFDKIKDGSVIEYLGMQDGQGKYYYKGFNMQQVDKGYKVMYAKDKILDGNHDYKITTLNDFYINSDQLIGNSACIINAYFHNISLNTKPFIPSNIPLFYKYNSNALDYMKASLKVAGKNGSYKSLLNFNVNKRVTKIDNTTLMVSGGIYFNSN